MFANAKKLSKGLLFTPSPLTLLTGVYISLNCGRPWPAAYINIIQNTHQIQVLTKPLCLAHAIFYSLPNNESGTKYRGLTNSAK